MAQHIPTTITRTLDGRPVGAREALRPVGLLYKSRKSAQGLAARDKDWYDSAGCTAEVVEVDGGWIVVLAGGR